jgi:hypothetical protein
MKKTLLPTFLAVAGIAFVGQFARAADYNPNDIILGFDATSGTGSDQNFLFNLGPAAPPTYSPTAGPAGVASSGYRDYSGASPLFVANINTPLTNIFGASWFSNANLFVGIAGVQNNDPFGSAVSGDPSRTLYLSNAETTFGTKATALSVISNSAMTADAGNIAAMGGIFALDTPYTGTNNDGAQVADSSANSWTSYQTYSPDGSTNTGSFGLTTGIQGHFGNGTVALDLQRILPTTTDANPSGDVRLGDYYGTFEVFSNGDVYYVPDIAAVPEPSPLALAVLGGIALVGLQIFRRRFRLS